MRKNFDFEFLFVGRNKEAWLQTALDFYVKKLSPFAKVSFNTLKPSSAMSIEDAIRIESEKILTKMSSDRLNLILDSTGKNRSSEEFADFLETHLDRGNARFRFVVGGAYGFGDSVRKKADETLSLSKMTFTHQTARLVLLEQTYRAVSIVNKTGYHH